MARDPEKARERRKRHRRRLKIQKYGEAYADVDMRGNHGNHANGARNGRWNPDKKMLSSHGYVLVRVGKEHPMAFGGGYAYEHDLVMVSYLGRWLHNGEIVHHKNEQDKTDNRIENLVLTNHAEHSRTHAKKKERDLYGWKSVEGVPYLPQRNTNGQFVSS